MTKEDISVSNLDYAQLTLTYYSGIFWQLYFVVEMSIFFRTYS